MAAVSGLARLVMGFALAAATVAAPVAAAQHHGHSTAHKTGRTSHTSKTSHASRTSRSKTSKSQSGRKTAHGKRTAKSPAKPASRAPGGTMTVPGGGLKVYCAAGKNPLMVRKMTQGAGTTVTVLCR
jgi:hypothetical protein